MMFAQPNEIVLITGGSRSGKSRIAIEMAQCLSPKIFIATARLQDEEMIAKAQAHREERGSEWITVEEAIAIDRVFQTTTNGVVVLDCLTLWIFNLMQDRLDVGKSVARLLESLQERKGTVIIVTNEVGSGIVPDNALAREFRDEAGRTNQKIAAAADRVIWMISGCPLTVKGKC